MVKGGRLVRLWPWLWSLGLTALVVYPWFLQPGYIFLLDFVWPEKLSFPPILAADRLQSNWPWELIWWLLAHVWSVSFVQKIAFSLPFFLAITSMWHLVSWLLHDHGRSSATEAALGTSTFYALNPFVITRAFMGQHYLLLAYSLTPWVLLLLLKFLAQPSPSKGIQAGLMVSAAMATNMHHMFLLGLLLLLIPYRWSDPNTRRALVWLLTPILMLVLLVWISGQWLVPAPREFNPLGPWARSLLPVASGNILLDTLSLAANWKSDLPFMLPHDAWPAFNWLSGALLAFIATGFVYSWQEHSAHTLATRLLLLTAISVFLAISVAHPLTAPVSAWLYRHVPLWLTMRDSGKFLTLVALVESIWLAFAFASAWPWRRLGKLISAIAFLLISLLCASAWHGFSGQIEASLYPTSWARGNELLASGNTKPRLLFLPWHLYLPFSFTNNRTVINPAPGYFTNGEVIAGDNSEVGGTAGRPFIYTESNRPLSQGIESIITAGSTLSDAGKRLAAHQIDYIALAPDSIDSDSYHWLYNQRDLALVFEEDELVIWKNTAVQ